ncbi:hypothetical protein BAE44_0007261, partial [Dichanthelium oligosanthes]
MSTNHGGSHPPIPARFGGKKEPEQNGHANGEANGSVRKRTADLAVYEQFEQQASQTQVRAAAVRDGNADVIQKPLLPPFESAEMRNLAETLLRDIIRGSPDVKWESIKGLENAKRLLKEAVVMPIKYPKYFTGLLSPWKGILLFGPPGTGKHPQSSANGVVCFFDTTPDPKSQFYIFPLFIYILFCSSGQPSSTFS